MKTSDFFMSIILSVFLFLTLIKITAMAFDIYNPNFEYIHTPFTAIFIISFWVWVYYKIKRI
jgi:hypothetical protein